MLKISTSKGARSTHFERGGACTFLGGLAFVIGAHVRASFASRFSMDYKQF
jgi:hypothetical protein